MVQVLLLSLGGTSALNGGAISVPEARPEQPSLMVPGISVSIGVLQRVIADVAPTDIPVLILGENGTGKEVLAAEIHRLSAHGSGPFIKFNCSSMSLDWLLSKELERADNGRQNGTVLLDEVSQLDPSKQAHLLNLLPNPERVLSISSLTSRIISTTTRDLTEEMRAGNFRDDLYFRLNGISLRLPPLRERKEDIPSLFAAFLDKHSRLLGRPHHRIKDSTVDLLLLHSWPGNVRELENLARKVAVLGDDELAISDFALSVETKAPATASTGVGTRGRSLKEAAREASRKAERELILQSLERTHWNRKRSARELQISYKALLYKLKQLDLDAGEKPEKITESRGA